MIDPDILAEKQFRYGAFQLSLDEGEQQFPANLLTVF